MKQTDENGSISYSRSIYVACKQQVAELLFFPNPANGFVSTTFENQSEEPMEIVVTDVLGNTVKKFTQNLIQGTNQVSLDVVDLPAGMYYAEFYGAYTKSNLRPGRFIKN